MSLIVKIMCANRGNDDHPRHGHQVISGVLEVDFYEAGPPAADQPGGRPGVYLTFRREDDGVPADVRRIELVGNVYVMNEAGRTVSRFEVAPFEAHVV